MKNGKLKHLTNEENHNSKLIAAAEQKIGELICAAISQYLGTSDWDEEEVRPRIERVKIAGHDQEVWLLDGKPIIEIWPFEFKTFIDGGSTKIEAIVSHRMFVAPNTDKDIVS